MQHAKNTISFLLGVVVFCWSCERVDPLEPELLPTLTNVQENIFSINCALSGCHAGASPQLGQNLSEGQAFSNIVNVPSIEMPSLFRVDPFDPDMSYLFLKITGAAGIVGGQMPLGRTPLSAEEIETIRQWIENGALNN